jgi:hypothetical protein
LTSILSRGREEWHNPKLVMVKKSFFSSLYFTMENSQDESDKGNGKSNISVVSSFSRWHYIPHTHYSHEM